MLNTITWPQAAVQTPSPVASRTPRVGYVLKMYPRFSETFVLNELLELEQQGLDLRVFALKKPDEGRFHADVARLRAPVTYLPETWSARPGLLAAGHRWAARRSGAGYWRALSGATRRGGPSLKHFWQAGYLAPRVAASGVTHLHAHFASSAAAVAWNLHQLLGLPYSVTAHAKDIFRHGVDRQHLVRKLRDAHFIVTVSDFNRDYLRDLAGADLAVARIYNGLDLDHFTPPPVERDDPPLVLGVGRLVEKKGFADLVRACGVLRDRGRDFRCAIVGTGEEGPALAALVSTLELSDLVSLPGPMPREALLQLYPRASVFAAPCVVGSDGNRDGLPTVLIEAMALGVPAVATPVTGIPELVRHEETGLLAPEGNPVRLAAAIERVLDDPALAAGLAERGRARVVGAFDLRTNVAELARLFQAVA